MTSTRSILCLGATALLFGCTAGTKATGNTGGSGSGTSGSSGGGTTGSGGNSSGSGGSVTDGGGKDIAIGDATSDGVCSSNTVQAEPVPLDLYVTVDLSKSMGLATTAGPTKVAAVRTALNTFFSDPKSVGLGAGFGYFPIIQAGLETTPTCTADGPCGTYGPCDRRKICVPNNTSATSFMSLCIDNTGCGGGVCSLLDTCTDGSYCAAAGTGTCPSTCMPFNGYCHARDVCDVAAYATPVVPIAPLPGSATGQAATLMTALGAHNPDGYSPTAAALKGAIQYTQQYAGTHPDHKVAIVLVTDGLPLAFTDFFDPTAGKVTVGFPRPECNPTAADIPGIAAIASAAATGTPAIPTFVIGVYSKDEGSSIAGMLNAIATGGGTAPAVIIDTSTQDVAQVLQMKLEDIRTQSIACDYQIPSTGVSFDQVNVSFMNGSTPTQIGHVPGADGHAGAGCDSRGGWYYDKDIENDAGTPSKITVCPATCQMFQANLSGKVNVVLGCPTINVD